MAMGDAAGAVDVLIVSLGSTGGLRVADADLADSLQKAGVSVAVVSATPPRAVRTLALTDLSWALAARRVARRELARRTPRAIIYSSTTAALLWPRPGAIRFDAPAAGNRPGRHGLWQRPLERRRLRRSPLLLPLSEGALRELPGAARRIGHELVLPVPTEASGIGPANRDIDAITYAANPRKKGLDRVLEAWRAVRRPGEELVVAGVSREDLRGAGIELPEEGVRLSGMLARSEYRALLRRARVFVCAPRREDYGQAQLEALADGCLLVTTPAPGPYAALPIARELDPRLVSEDLAGGMRIALDDPPADYSAHALKLLAPFGSATVDRLVTEQLLPRLLA
jgi:glycosyltransferase involved in cell wall biosynthesis